MCNAVNELYITRYEPGYTIHFSSGNGLIKYFSGDHFIGFIELHIHDSKLLCFNLSEYKFR